MNERFGPEFYREGAGLYVTINYFKLTKNTPHAIIKIKNKIIPKRVERREKDRFININKQNKTSNRPKAK